MEFLLLADRPEVIPKIASWYFEQWGRARGSTLDRAEQRLQSFLNRDRIPLIILAVDGDEILGAAQLKFREMDIYPEREHWLGGVYVPEAHRGKSVASTLVREAIRQAQALGVEQLHLQTEALDGGLYARLGWTPRERVNYKGNEVLVMENDLAAQ